VRDEALAASYSLSDENSPMIEEHGSQKDGFSDESKVRTAPSARARALMLIAFVGSYTLACYLPALHMTGQETMWRGVELLSFGIMSLKLGQLSWLANFLAIATVRAALLGQRKTVNILSAVTLLFALQTYTLLGKDIAIGRGDFNVVQVVAIGPGFYVWLLALMVPFIGSELHFFLDRRSPTTSKRPPPK
jgi:hypothetical protein